MSNDEKSLNRQLAEALHGELHYETHSGTVYFWRVGKDAINEAAYDSLEDYEHSLDAVAAVCKEHCITLKLDFETNYVELVHYPDCVNGVTYAGNALMGTIEKAAAWALLQWALAQRKDGAE